MAPKVEKNFITKLRESALGDPSKIIVTHRGVACETWLKASQSYNTLPADPKKRNKRKMQRASRRANRKVA